MSTHTLILRWTGPGVQDDRSRRSGRGRLCPRNPAWRSHRFWPRVSGEKVDAAAEIMNRHRAVELEELGVSQPHLHSADRSNVTPGRMLWPSLGGFVLPGAVARLFYGSCFTKRQTCWEARELASNGRLKIILGRFRGENVIGVITKRSSMN